MIPRDAVAAVTKEYGDMCWQHTMRAITTVTTSEEVIAAWQGQ